MRRSSSVLAGQVAIGAGALLAWQVLAARKVIDPFFFSKPSDIGARVGEWVLSGTVFPHLGTTLLEALLSFVLGVLAGVTAGFVLGRSGWLALVVEPYIQIANAIPRIVLAPIFLLWFGLGIWSKVALGVTTVFFIVFFNTFQGVRDVEPVLLNNARILGASERQLARHVLLPSALAWIFSSLQVSIGFAIIAAVVGEYMGSSRGIGYVIAQAEGVFDTTGVFAGIVVLSTVVVLVGRGVKAAEAHLLRWKNPPPVR